MTEKRFSVKNNWITDNYIGKLLNIDFNTITDANLCCELLNQIEDEKKQNGKIASKFLEENEQLKQELHKIKVVNEMLSMDFANSEHELYKENEQLKSTINTLTHDNTKMKKVLNTTKKENEHIKNTIQEAYNNERTAIGKSVLKQLLEAIQ